MSCSFFINDSIIDAVEGGLSAIGDYLDSRLVKVSYSFTAQKAQHDIKDNLMRHNKSFGDYGAIETSVWTPERLI